MSGRPRLLDLFCGAGGCSVGYSRAGFDVVGVDVRPMPRYPFEFHRGDALEYVAAHGHEFDVIHASPPCQAFTPLRAVCGGKEYPDFVAATRAALVATGRPYVIENVVQAPIRATVVLCGAMFGLRVYRHRGFETSLLVTTPPHQRHVAPTAWGRDRKRRYLQGDHFLSVTGDVGRYAGDAMGIDWMTGNELSQAIPPAYSEWIGRQLIAALDLERAS